MKTTRDIYEALHDVRRNIISKMQELDITRIDICPILEDYLKDHPNDDESDYEYYRSCAAPSIPYFEGGVGKRYDVMFVELYRDGDNVYFVLFCENDGYKIIPELHISSLDMVPVLSIIENVLDN